MLESPKRVLDSVVSRTLMCVTSDEFLSVVDYLQGYDSCCKKMDLAGGFRDWLGHTLGGSADDTAWPDLVVKALSNSDAATSRDRSSNVSVLTVWAGYCWSIWVRGIEKLQAKDTLSMIVVCINASR